MGGDGRSIDGMRTGMCGCGVVLTCVGLGIGGWGARAQTTLPAAQTTATRPTTETTAPGGTKEVVETHLKVTWVDAMLTIAAENAGLNQILREVSRRTGMKVTGGVADERVYGSYGPGAAEAVLTALLTGTQCNLLLKESTADGPMELILSPRRGGASPPSPSSYVSAGEEPEESLPARGSNPGARRRSGNYGNTSAAGGAPGLAGASQGLGGGQGTDGAQSTPVASQDAGGTARTSGAGDAQGANEQRSPQDIYNELMKLQQQKTPPAPVPPPPE